MGIEATNGALNSKVAVVTGASKGIGVTIARRLAAEGASVALLARTVDALEALATELGDDALAVACDVGDPSSVRAAFATIGARYGRVDVLVNNAGVETHAPFWDVSESDYDKVLNVNLKGTFFATQAVVRHLRATGRPGRVVNISSVHEELPFPNFAAYCASKGALKMLTRNLAVELGPLGITINNVAPGAIVTPINRALLNDAVKLRSLTEQIPLARLGTTDDVAGVAAFLASDEAAYVTGSTYVVDGGLTWFYQEQ